jgi:hypothetical protein
VTDSADPPKPLTEDVRSSWQGFLDVFEIQPDPGSSGAFTGGRSTRRMASLPLALVLVSMLE